MLLELIEDHTSTFVVIGLNRHDVLLSRN